MNDSTPYRSRRDLLKLGGASAALLSAAAVAAQTGVMRAVSPTTGSTAPDPSTEAGTTQPQAFDAGMSTADILIDTLVRWDVRFVFGIVGDGINPLIEALRKREDRIRFIGVRHEEAAAFMACGYAKHTGKLGVCLATTGPGAVHLMNGLYDAKMDATPVLAITGMTFHDLGGTHFMQSVDTLALMADVACYNVAVTGPIHAGVVGNLACRAALADRGVAHLTIAKDTQAMKLGADHASMENHGLRTPGRWEASRPAPDPDILREAADLLNAGTRIAILAGQGALGARAEVTELAAKLKAPIAKALLGRAVIADDSPYSTGGIGHLGTAPSEYIMQHCDTLVILGSRMPWVDFYPKPGQARALQVDLKGDHIGLRYPVELGVVGDVRSTLRALLPLLETHADGAFLADAQSRMRDWNALVSRAADVSRSPLRPHSVLRALSDALDDRAVISLDCGANTHFAARVIRLTEHQRLTGTGMLATMAPGLPYTIAAQLAFPDRQCVAVVGDGGFSQLMAELATAAKYKLPIKVVVLKNDSLAEVRFEQEGLGNPVYGCDLSPIDFVAFAKACGLDGFRCATPGEIRPAIQALLHSPRGALLEAVVDPNEKPTLPSEFRA